MTSDATVRGPAEAAYVPRQMSSLGIWDIGGWRFKSYLIRANAKRPLSDAMVAAARMKVASAREKLEATTHFNTGFVALHESIENIWLLAKWWTKDGTCAELRWSANYDTPATFTDVEYPMTECAWELVPINFERCAWAETMLKPGGGGLVAYLRNTMPDGSY